jgi:hypothetical protein
MQKKTKRRERKHLNQRDKKEKLGNSYSNNSRIANNNSKKRRRNH